MHLDPRLVQIIIGAVVLAWLGLMVASVLRPGIEVPAELHMLAMGIGTAAVATLRKNDGGGGGDGGPTHKA